MLLLSHYSAHLQDFVSFVPNFEQVSLLVVAVVDAAMLQELLDGTVKDYRHPVEVPV